LMSGGGQNTTQTSKVELSPEQREFLGYATPLVRDFAADVPDRYPGSQIVAPNATQLGAQQVALGGAGNQAALATAGRNVGLDYASGNVWDNPQRNEVTDNLAAYSKRAQELPLGVANWAGAYEADMGKGVNDTLGIGRSDIATGLAVGGADTRNYEGVVGKNYNSYLTGVDPRFAAVTDATRSNLSPFLSGDIWQPENNPALQGAIDASTRPIMENFQRSVLPAINDEAISRGQFGGSRQEIGEGLAATGAAQAVGDTASRLVNDQYRTNIQAQLQAAGLDANTALGSARAADEATFRGLSAADAASARALSERGDLLQQAQGMQGDQLMKALGLTADVQGRSFDRTANAIGQGLEAERAGLGLETDLFKDTTNAQLKGAALLPQLSGLQTTPAVTMGGVGDVQQAHQQALLNEKVGNFNYDEWAPFLQAQELVGLVNGIPGGTAVATGQMPRPGATQALGGAATGAALGSAIMPGVGTMAGAGLGALLPFLF
jgi:hypothetical protein